MLSARDGLGLRILRATNYTDQHQIKGAEKLKHEGWTEKDSDPKKVFLGSTFLAPIKPRQQRATTVPCLRGHPSQSRDKGEKAPEGGPWRPVTRKVSPSPIEEESATGSSSASSKPGSTRLSPPDNPSLPASPKTFISEHS